VRVQLSRAILAVAICSAIGFGSARAQDPAQPAQQAQQKKPEWKDRAEYDLVQSIDKERDPKKKLELLNQWRDKYPASDFKVLRLQSYLMTYHALNDPNNMLATAQDILKEDPTNLQALYWINLLVVSMNQNTPERLDLGDKAAKTLAGSVDTLFAPDKKPAGTSDADWQKGRTDAAATAQRTIGWVAMQRKQYPDAEKAFEAELKLNPNDAEAAYWLGSVILIQKLPEKQADGLFYIARAAAYDGPGALPPDRRKVVEDYLRKAYTSYHGQDPQGFQELLATARAQATPPAGFKIESEAAIKANKDKQLEASNPALALWLKLKDALSTADGSSYFESNMKGALVPPEGQPAFRATVISADGTARATKSVTVAIADSKTPDARLTFGETPMAGKPEPGTVIEFRGVAAGFTPQPFLVTFETEKKYVSGWPAPAAPAHKAPVRKKQQ
jgi:tetratricopeptide (TPR) repeat protein